MKLTEMKSYLSSHGVEEGELYTIGGLGAGEIDGIEQIDNEWFTYFSERGKKRSYVKWDNESKACEYIANRAEKLAKHYGAWRE